MQPQAGLTEAAWEAGGGPSGPGGPWRLFWEALGRSHGRWLWKPTGGVWGPGAPCTPPPGRLGSPAQLPSQAAWGERSSGLSGRTRPAALCFARPTAGCLPWGAEPPAPLSAAPHPGGRRDGPSASGPPSPRDGNRQHRRRLRADVQLHMPQYGHVTQQRDPPVPRLGRARPWSRSGAASRAQGDVQAPGPQFSHLSWGTVRPHHHDSES